MGSARPAYEYTTLESTRSQVRLLRLLPGSDNNDPVEIAIDTYALEETPPFIALSYTWGTTSASSIIISDGSQLAVSQSLHSLLTELRRGVRAHSDSILNHHIWVDQICIDQSSLHERSQQVMLMSRIYQQAARVIVWLTGSLFSHYSNDEYAFIRYLLRNPYFTRLWIVQEILLAREVHVLCETGRLLPWQYVAGMAEQVLDIYPQAQNPAHRSGFETLLSRAATKYFTSLKWAIDRFGTQRCKDPRDKVYGLLGLVRQEDQVKVDYRQSTHQVFLDAVYVLRTRLREETRIELSSHARAAFRPLERDYRQTVRDLARHMELRSSAHSSRMIRALLRGGAVYGSSRTSVRIGPYGERFTSLAVRRRHAPILLARGDRRRCQHTLAIPRNSFCIRIAPAISAKVLSLPIGSLR